MPMTLVMPKASRDWLKNAPPWSLAWFWMALGEERPVGLLLSPDEDGQEAFVRRTRTAGRSLHAEQLPVRRSGLLELRPTGGAFFSEDVGTRVVRGLEEIVRDHPGHPLWSRLGAFVFQRVGLRELPLFSREKVPEGLCAALGTAAALRGAEGRWGFALCGRGEGLTVLVDRDPSGLGVQVTRSLPVLGRPTAWGTLEIGRRGSVIQVREAAVDVVSELEAWIERHADTVPDLGRLRALKEAKD